MSVKRENRDSTPPVDPGAGRSTSLQKEIRLMRVMVIVKANKESELGVMPDPKMLAEMDAFNQELIKAGVMVSGDGLRASKLGKRVHFSGTNRTVTDGPFAET